MKRLLSLAVLSLSLALAGSVHAGTLTGTLSVSATVIQSCSATTTTTINSANVIPGANTVTSNGDVSVTCTTGAPYHIALDAGQHFQSTRNLANSSQLLTYFLSKDAAGSMLWGDSDYANTYPAGSSLADSGNGSSQAHTVYGWFYAPAGQQAGTYTDVVNVAVYY